MDYIAFVDRIRATLTNVITAEEQRKILNNPINNNLNDGSASVIIPWNWLCQNLISLLQRFPKGVTEVALLTDLHQMWEDYSVQWKSGFANSKEQINSIYESNAISADEIYNLEIDSFQEDKFGNIVLSLSDGVSSKNIDLLLHRESCLFKSAYTRYNLLNRNRKLKLIGAQMLYDVPAALDKNTNVCLLPTDFIVFTLAEEDLLKFSQFKSADQIQPQNPLPNTIKGILLKSVQDRMRNLKRLFLYPDKNNLSTYITLILQGDAFARYQKMLKKNDTLFIENPDWIDGMAYVGYETVLYTLPQPFKQELMPYSSPSKPSSQGHFLTKTNDEGVKDMKYFPERITSRDWNAKTSGNALLLKTCGKGYSQTITAGNKVTRYIFLCEDLEDSKEISVTFYDSLAIKAAQCLPGSIIFLMGVDIEGEKFIENKTGKVWTAFSSKKSKGEIYNVSELPGLVNSLTLLPSRPLKDSADQRIQSFIVKANLIDFAFLDPPTNYIHSTCYGKIQRTGPGMYKCDVCKKDITFDEVHVAELKSTHMLPFASQSPVKATQASRNNIKVNAPIMTLLEESDEVSVAYNIHWTISDGISQLDVFAAPRVDNELMRVSAKEYRGLSDARKESALPALGWYKISLSLYDGQNNMYRMDQISPVNFAAEVRNEFLKK